VVNSSPSESVTLSRLPRRFPPRYTSIAGKAFFDWRKRKRREEEEEEEGGGGERCGGVEVEGGKREKGKREKERRSESLYDLDLKLPFHNIQMSPFPNSRSHTRMYKEKDTIDHPWFIPHVLYLIQQSNSQSQG